MISKKITPSHLTYTYMIDIYSKLGMVDTVVRMLVTFKAQYQKSSTYIVNRLSNLLGSATPEIVELLFRQLNESKVKPDVILYNYRIKAYQKTKNALQVQQIFREMKINGILPDTVTYQSVLLSLSQEREARCFEILDEMKRNNVSFNNTNYQILIQSSRSPVLLSLRYYRDMMFFGHLPNIYVFKAMLSKLVTTKKI